MDKLFLNEEEAMLVAAIISSIPHVQACCPQHLKMALLIMAYAIDRNPDEIISIIKALHNADKESAPQVEVRCLKTVPGVH